MFRGNKTILACAAALALALPAAGDALAGTVFSSGFDDLTLGPLLPDPGDPGQDGWYAVDHPGSGVGEIQAAVGAGGAALRQFAPRTNPPDSRVFDARLLTAPDLGADPLVTLEFDAYFASSDLSTINPYAAGLAVRGGPHPGFSIIEASFGGGNGEPKSQTGVGLVLYAFNGVDNNDDIPLEVGQQLAWDVWHHVRVSIDQAADTYIAITVDGQTQALGAWTLPRSEDGGTWLRGQLAEVVEAGIVALPWDEINWTDDTVVWDNVSLIATNAQAAVLPGADALTEWAADLWGASADDGAATVADDTVEFVTGASSLRFDTDGCFDTRLWTPLARDADWDLTGRTGVALSVRADNANGFQGESPWLRLHTTQDDYVELHSAGEILNGAQGTWLLLEIPLAGDAAWIRTETGSPDLAHVAWLEIHADTWDCGFTLWFDGLTFVETAPVFAGWQMLQRDAQHTGRADFTVPAERLGDSFFDVFSWQTPSPGSPGEGGFSSTSLVFADGAGPGGADLVVGGYHWPKGVQGMDRLTGETYWSGNPDGGESIATRSPAFSPDGTTLYVTNDATDHPLMGFTAATGPAAYRHNGGDPEPQHLQMDSPVVAPDGRLFLRAWVDRPYGGYDDGATISENWAAATAAESGHSDAALYQDGGVLKVVVGCRSGEVVCFDGDTGAELWRAPTPPIDATATIDPAGGRIFVAGGSDSVWIVGLDKDGAPLWGDAALLCHQYVPEVNEPELAQSAGCLSHDGATYYFQTVGQNANGKLYAVDTATGAVKWSLATGSSGWESLCSSPIVTPNGVVVVGNNEGDAYLAVLDEDDHGTLLDTLAVDPDGNARACPTMDDAGRLYLPLRTVWSKVNGGGAAPSGEVENVFCALDLAADAQATLPPPPDQAAVALNARVQLTWTPVADPNGLFGHYAVYRAEAPFASVSGMTPIATVPFVLLGEFTDGDAINGTSYHYAVTSVTTAGGEETTVASIGPRTPRDETDLQVVCLARTPRFPRYDAIYTYHEISEPGGFGPYVFSAATGLGSGQTSETPRWPGTGEPLAYTATVRNRGTNDFVGTVTAVWTHDGVPAQTDVRAVAMAPGDTIHVELGLFASGASDEISIHLDVADDRSANNDLTAWLRSVPCLTYIDRSRLEEFREETAGYPQAATDDFIDWLNRHAARMNQMFADQGSPKRIHYDVLEVLDDGAPDPDVDRLPFAIFPFRCRAGEGSFRLSGYYDAGEDLDFGLIHEISHQLGLIDIYQFDIPASANLVSGTGYTAVPCMMHGCSPFYSDHSALAMAHWQDDAHGYYGQYLYELPEFVRLRLLGIDGQPLAGATVTLYQYAERPGLGKVVTDQAKAQGATDAQGYWILPNVDIDENLVPPIGTGDELHDNPFGYVAVVGTNGVFLIKVEHEGYADYCWLDITEVNVAYWQGQTATATFDRQLRLGGGIEMVPPYDLAELNAASWEAWAEGATAAAFDDTGNLQVGAGSVRMETTGGFDTYLRYPGDHLASWDLTGAQELRIRFYAQNEHGFQGDNPLIRLAGADGRIDFVPTADLLNGAIGQWVECVVPLAGGGNWVRTDFGTVSLGDIRALEVHADTWDYGFSLWVDGVTFWPHPLTGVPGDGTAPPARLTLSPAAPNPFNPSTTLAFATPREGPATLRLYDVRGLLVRTLHDGVLPAGWHLLRWDGLDDAGRQAASGVYFARLEREGEVISRKLSLVK